MQKRRLLRSLSVVFLFLITSCKGKEYRLNLKETLIPIMKNDNFRNFYHVFVGSFSDSNKDGIGDLQGVINRLDYLNDGDPTSGLSLGVDGLYLSPIHPSPSYHKYDVRDYKAIDKSFGDLATFDKLIAAANSRGISVILDIVVNHTSKYHPWFIAAKNAILTGDMSNPYIDYYTILKKDERRAGHIYYPINDEYYYEGNFSSDMPEINPESEAIKIEWASIIEFWLNRGVAGFRLDAVKYIDLTNQTASLTFWDWFSKTAKAIKSEVYIVGEVWSPPSGIAPYYEYFSNFDFSMANSEGMIASVMLGYHDINEYMTYLVSNRRLMTSFNTNAIMAPFLSNHDMDRAAGYLSVADYKMHMAASLYQFTYGTSFIYYGEEIGMRGSRGTANTDANRRLAMLWGDKDSVQNPAGTSYNMDLQTKSTVKSEKKNKDSLYNHYKKIIAIKNAYPAIARGEYTPVNFGSELVGAMIYRYDDNDIMIIHNIGDESFTYSLTDHEAFNEFKTIVSYLGKGGATISDTTLKIDGLTTLILKA